NCRIVWRSKSCSSVKLGGTTSATTTERTSSALARPQRSSRRLSIVHAEAHSAPAEYHSTVAGTDGDANRTPTNRSVGITQWLNDVPAVLVANPTAHSGKAADWIRTARALLDDAHIPHRFVATEPDGRTID